MKDETRFSLWNWFMIWNSYRASYDKELEFHQCLPNWKWNEETHCYRINVSKKYQMKWLNRHVIPRRHSKGIIDEKNLATYHDNFCVKKYFIPKKYISKKKATPKIKMATYLHHESAGAEHLLDRKSQATMQFHISFQILSRSIAGRARIDERGLRLTAYWSRSPPMSLQ